MKSEKGHPLFLRKLVSYFAVGLILFLVFGDYLTGPPVFAANPTMSNLSTGKDCGATGTCVFNSFNLVAGTTVVITVQVLGAGITVSQITDTATLSYSLVSRTQSPSPTGGIPIDQEIWSAVTGSSSGGDVVTVTLSGTPSHTFQIAQQISVQMPFVSVTTFSSSFNPASCTSCTVVQTSSPVNVPGGSMVMAVDWGTACPDGNTNCNSGLNSGGPSESPTWTTMTNLLSGWSCSCSSPGQATAGSDAYLYETNALSFTVTVSSSSNTHEYDAWGLSVIVFSTSTSSTVNQVQTIGSCPTKNTATFTPANSTIYFYSGNALGSEVMLNVSVFVASVTSGTHTLRLLVYAGSASSVTVNNPLTKVFEASFPVSTGTTNDKIVTSGTISIGTIAGGNVFTIGFVADDHFRINQSSLSGLTTEVGTASNTVQPASFSSLGTSVGTKLNLCGFFAYQSRLTSISTVTAAGSTTVTQTSIVTSVDSNTAINTSTGFTLLLLVILTPAMALGGLVMFYTRNGLMGITAMTGGLVIGAALGNNAGMVPLWIVFTLLFVCVFWMLAVFRSGGGGGA